ncbi:MAG: ATP-dependent Clp protease adaptor ClpS [Balneolaceae bacterium]|nr:ATP-dependent Clp protease adaptor ClpS [Balneolaceae bacterium]
MGDPLLILLAESPEPEPKKKPEPDRKKTPSVEVMTEEKEEEETPWRVILYNDEIHTFDEVIEQLIKATGCSQGKAEKLTFKVHNEGKANVYEGSFEECFEVNGVLKEIQLITEIKG